MKRIFPASLVIPAILTMATTSWAEPQWIWLSKSSKDGERVTLKTSFEITGDVKTAVLNVSVDNGAAAFINGKQVLDNPDWSDPSKGRDEDFLVKGKNELRLEARNEGGVAAAVAQLTIEYADGKKGRGGDEP